MITVILDCDIASCLAKINRIDLLGVAFPDCEAYITESVSIELLRSSQAGFSFPDRIFESIPVISLNQDERIMLQGMPKSGSIHYTGVQRVTDTPTFRSGRKWTLARISCYLEID